MLNPTTLVLYVANPAASARFYGTLLKLRPIEQGADHVLFMMASGLRLGLWSRQAADPAVTAAGGGAELAIPVASADIVDALCDDWWGRGLLILQPPADLDIGRTFVALDPDGHRLRVYAEADEAMFPVASGRRFTSIPSSWCP